MNNVLVFREEGRNRNNIKNAYEHNERTLKRYFNRNIDLNLSKNNYYYKRPNGTYEEMLDQLLVEGIINVKGLKADADLFSEIIVAVNRDYFLDKETEYIDGFFQTAYDYVKSKIGDERLILSAVLHKDEVTDGKVNYHMHICLVPVVEKKRYYTKRSREYKELAAQVGVENIKENDVRLLKNIEKQISHSKFYNSFHDKDGNMVYGYTIWQDELLAKLKKGGYDVERGIVGNHAVHIHPTHYKNFIDRLEYEAEHIMTKIQTKEVGENIVVSKESYQAIEELRKVVSKEKVALEIGLDKLQEQQNRLNSYQHNAYLVKDKNLVELQEECNILKEKYRVLKERFERLYQKLQKLKEIFVAIYRCIQNIYEVAQSPDNTISLETFKKYIVDYIDLELRREHMLCISEITK